jgi:hypothetical protein
MSGQWHPGTEALAEYREGLIGGFRRRRLAAHVAGCGQCASVIERLDAVGSVLASVPAPAVPDEVERRIVAALAAEATARQTEGTARQGAAPSAEPGRHARPSGASGAPGSSRRRFRRPQRPQRPRRFRPVMTLVPAVACLLLAGFGYLLSNLGGSSGPSGAVSAASASSAASAAQAAPGLPAEGSGTAGSVPGALSPTTGGERANGAPAGFVVTASGTSYQRATLGVQVRHQMAVQAANRSAEGQMAAGGGSAPSPSLAGCVLQLTRNVPPSLVDRATYQGEPAYVIAVQAKAWVVGLGCTAGYSELITSIPLPGPG